jgi:drug/metabolite transporter (DMT)-like permease
MNIDIKTLAIFLPLVAACATGLNYAMNGRIMLVLSMPTWICIFGTASIVVALALHAFSPMKIDFSLALARPTIFYILISLAASICAWLCMLTVLKNISATYAAIGEISYPFFAALFAYLIFQAHELDWKMAVGGALIMIGSVIVITDKIRIGG